MHLLSAVIYDHMKYGNVHLQMTADSTLFDHRNLLRRGIIARTIKEITLMNISAYCTPLNKSTDQMIKLGFPPYLLITMGLSWLQHKEKEECYTHEHPYMVHMKFQNSHEWIHVFSPS